MSNIDWTFVNKVLKQSQMNLSKEQIYKVLLDNKLIKKNGLPTKYAQNNGLVGSKPLEHDKLRTQYRRLIALIPNNYIIRLRKQPKSTTNNKKIKYYVTLRKSLLNKPLQEFSREEWLGLLKVGYRAYQAIKSKNLILSSKLRLHYQRLCQMYITYSPDTIKAKQDVLNARKESMNMP